MSVGDDDKRRNTLRTPTDLVEGGLIESEAARDIARVCDEFAVAVSPEIVDRIKGSAQDDNGVARQFVPDARELIVAPEERADPIGDLPYMPIKGITHRYPDRLLLIPTHACAVYCRFCFRREKVGPGEEYLNAKELGDAIDYIRRQPEVREVILTGGDPLVLSVRRIKHIIAELAAIKNIDIIRFHTRIPIVAPNLITSELIEAFDVDKIICVVVHANHASEIGPAAKDALKRLRKAGVMLVSHSVLLKDVNDNVKDLTELLRELLRNGVKPYYLHHCDLAEGISHFRTSFEKGQELMRAIRGHVSGLAQPEYVLHIPDGSGKVPIGPSYMEREGDFWIVTDYLGRKRPYPTGADVAAPSRGERNFVVSPNSAPDPERT